MLRAYGPGCDGSIIDANTQRSPDHATWIDLEEPTKEEEALVERCIHLDVPTEDEMAEIERDTDHFVGEWLANTPMEKALAAPEKAAP